MSSTKKNRWIILAALLFNNLCLGATYTWSIFNKPLMETHGWQLSEVSLAYSMLLIVTFFSNLISGQLQNKLGPRKLMLLSLIFWGGGWFLTSFATSIPQLYLFFSFTVGIGAGLGYNTIIATIPRWFPDCKGLANGLVVGASGLAPILFAPVGYFLLDNFGVGNAFKYLGLTFLIIMSATFWLITAPSEGWKPEGWEPPEATEATGVLQNKTTKEMLRDPVFYLLWFVLLAGATAGMIMTGHASGIGMELVNMTGSQAAMMVSLLAVMSFGGRLLMGSLSDKIGRYRTILIIVIAIVADMFFFGTVHSFGSFVVALSVIGFSFGSIMSVFPALCADTFGSAHIASNWSVLYSGYTVASFVGPMSAAKCVEAYGSYVNVFVLSGVLAALALIAQIAAMIINNRRLAKKETANEEYI